jgi:AAA+ superfamily predicted ATPase
LKHDYFKLGNEFSVSNLEEEHFLKKHASLVGFGMEFNANILRMFAETYTLVSSCKKGLLSLEDNFYFDSAPFEYVFEIEHGFFGIFYSIDDGTDYRYKCSVVKQRMTKEEAINIIYKLKKDFIKHNKKIQETVFKKGEKVLDDVILAPELKKSIVSDMKNFLKSKSKYNDFGMIWKRGYVFHGPPGNGKTLFLRKLSEAFGLQMTDITHRINNDGTLNLPSYADLYDNNTTLDLYKLAIGNDQDCPPEVYYLEDMDKVIGKNDADFGRITLSNFLTTLDGVSRLADGVIIIGTTNYKDNLESSILGRPGRFERVFEFPKPGPNEIMEFFKRKKFLIDTTKNTQRIANIMVEKKFSMAFVEDFVLTGIIQIEKHSITLQQAEDIIQDLEHYNKLEAQTEGIGFVK